MHKCWAETKIDNVLSSTIGGVWGVDPELDEVNVKVVRSTEFRASGVLFYESAVDRSIKKSQLVNRKLIQGDILLEKSGGGPDQPVGRVVFVKEDIPNNTVCSNFVQLVRPDASKIIPRYLFLVLWQWHYENRTLQFQAQTTGIRNLRTPDYLAQDINLPPLPEQKRIVDLISSVDCYIDALEQQAESARKSRSAVLHEMLSAGGDEWTETTLSEVADWSGGITPSMANPKFWESGTIPWISSGDVLRMHSDGVQKRVTETALQETTLRLLPKGTVLIVVRSGILLHTLPIALLNEAATINQDIKAGIPKSFIHGSFLCLLLQMHATTILERCRKTGTTVQSISTDAFLTFNIAIPSPAEQKRIVDLISTMDDEISATEKLISETKQLRSGLLSDLLSGDHEIPESYDKVMGAA